MGLLPAGNEQQVPFAYKMFLRDDELGWKQSILFVSTRKEFLPLQEYGILNFYSRNKHFQLTWTSSLSVYGESMHSY